MILICPLKNKILLNNKKCSTCIFSQLYKKNKCGFDEYEPGIKKENKMNKLICFLFGHKWFYSLYTDHKMTYCSRCGKIK